MIRHHFPRRARCVSVLAKAAAFAPLMAAGVLAASPARADETKFKYVYNEAIRGGVVVDGVAMKSTSVTAATGNIQIQIPVGATIERAWLVSSVGAYGTQPNPTPFLSPVPVTPRQVVLGSGATVTTFALEGMPQNSFKNGPGAAVGAVYGSWVNEVTTELKALIPVGLATPVNVLIAERGDGTQIYRPTIFGHSLAVVYKLPTAPLRNVVVGTGLMGGPGECDADVTDTITLAKPTTLVCKKPFPISVSVIDNHEDCETPGNLCRFSANGTVLSTAVAGLDEDISVASTSLLGKGLDFGLLSTGSFGASGALGESFGLGKTYTDNKTLTDSITGKPALDRNDDELYDLFGTIAEGATTVTIKYESKSCDALPMVAFQTDVDCGPPCAVDGDCKATELCHDAGAKACIPKVINGVGLPAGGTINGKCSTAQAARACVSGACETSDDKCGLLTGSVCTATAQCRTGVCGASKKCEGVATDAGAPDGGKLDSGPLDSGTPDGGVPNPSTGVIVPDSGDGTGGAVANGTVEGGGVSCSTSPSSSATIVPMILAAALGLASLRRRRK